MPNSARSILAVDDYPGIPKMLAVLFAHHRVVAATAGAEALCLARSRPYDAYVLDFDLPDMTGTELAAHIRAFEPNAPVVIFSSRAQPRLAGTAAWNAWIDKTGDIEALVTCVDRLLYEQVVRNRAAAHAELSAISAHLREQDAELAAQMSDVARRIRHAWHEHCDRDVRLQAFHAYLAAGGTRGGFTDLVNGREPRGGH